MPQRDNEYYVGLGEDLRFCTKHNRYYDVHYGCQLCYLAEHRQYPKVQLYRCPKCERLSLFWNADKYQYECLNTTCKAIITEKDVKK